MLVKLKKGLIILESDNNCYLLDFTGHNLLINFGQLCGKRCNIRYIDKQIVENLNFIKLIVIDYYKQKYVL